VKTAIVAEIKRNPRKIDLNLLRMKANSIKRELAQYALDLRGLSMEEM
jgi:hypothetical protein